MEGFGGGYLDGAELQAVVRRLCGLTVSRVGSADRAVTRSARSGSGEYRLKASSISRRVVSAGRGADYRTGVEGELPDVAFALQISGAGVPDDDIAKRIVGELEAVAPDGWQRLYVEFAVTVSGDASEAVFTVLDDDVVVRPPRSVVELVRAHRAASAAEGGGPWFRMLVQATPGGVLDVDYDWGERPFPDGQLLPAAAYRADLREFPRRRIPLWLAAYTDRRDRQARSPAAAAAAARSDRRSAVRPVAVQAEFPSLSVIWARWCAIAAAFVAVGSEWGPRVRPSVGWFESPRRSGSTLYVLPGGRAVLSGGVWDVPALDAAYNERVGFPDLFAGAPEWVAGPLLDARAAAGLLSFCFWWESGRWNRGESPPARQCASAVPGVWTTGTAARIITQVTGGRGDGDRAAVDMVAAAESGAVSREVLSPVLDGVGDIDSALFELEMAGLVKHPPAQ